MYIYIYSNMYFAEYVYYVVNVSLRPLGSQQLHCRWRIGQVVWSPPKEVCLITQQRKINI